MCCVHFVFAAEHKKIRGIFFPIDVFLGNISLSCRNDGWMRSGVLELFDILILKKDCDFFRNFNTNIRTDLIFRIHFSFLSCFPYENTPHFFSSSVTSVKERISVKFT